MSLPRHSFLDNARPSRSILLGSSVLLFLLTAVLSASPGQVEKYFAPESIIRFAEYLYQTGDYLRAAGEFQRYLFSFSSPPPDADSVLFKTGVCFRLAQHYDQAVTSFRNLIHSHHSSALLEDAYIQISYTRFLEGKYEDSLSLVDQFVPSLKTEAKKLKLLQLKGVNLIYQRRWDEAAAESRSLQKSYPAKPFTPVLMEFAEQGKTLPRKSPFLAGLMSALIPGTGKIYAQRTTDGLMSLLSVAVTAWQAYEGFHKDGLHSVKGWIYGSLGAFFYFGNIYGSVTAAKIFNEQAEDKFLEQIRVVIHVQF